MAEKRIPGTQLISRACSLLRLFTGRTVELTLSEMAHQSGLHVATTHRILQALTYEGLLLHDSSTGKYRLGLAFLRLGELAKAGNDLYRISYPWAEKLAHQTKETIHLDIMTSQFRIVRILAFASTYAVAVNADLYTFPIPHTVSAGKLLLAFLSDSQIDDYIAQGLKRLTHKTICEPLILKNELEKIRDKGFATNYEEQEIGYIAVAAPVINHEGTVIAALSLGAPNNRMNEDTFEKMLNEVINTSKSISKDFGYMGN